LVWPQSSLAEVLQEFSWRILESGKYRFQTLVSQMTFDGFAEHATEVGRDCQVAAFVELGLIESRPLAVDFTALHRTTHNNNNLAVTGLVPPLPFCRPA